MIDGLGNNLWEPKEGSGNVTTRMQFPSFSQTQNFFRGWLGASEAFRFGTFQAERTVRFFL